MRVVLDSEATMPFRAHDTDAGYDLFSRETKVIKAHSYECFDTGVHMEIPKGYVGFLKSKSGLNVKHSITGTGVIDSGYTGSIVVKLYNDSDEDFLMEKHMRLIQIVLLPVFTPELEEVPSLDDTERGDSGFGSTGK